jgi:hypothetical protein
MSLHPLSTPHSPEQELRQKVLEYLREFLLPKIPAAVMAVQSMVETAVGKHRITNLMQVSATGPLELLGLYSLLAH